MTNYVKDYINYNCGDCVHYSGFSSLNDGFDDENYCNCNGDQDYIDKEVMNECNDGERDFLDINW